MKLRDRAHPLAVLCSLVAACSLAGCGGGNEPSLTPAPPPAATPATAPAQTPPPASDTTSAQNTGAESGSSESSNSGDGMPNSDIAESGTSDAAGAAMGGSSGSVPGASISLPNLNSLFTSMSSGMSGGSPYGNSGNPYGGSNPYGNGQQAPTNPAPSEEEDYLTKAKYAFAIGKEAAAEQYFYAQLLAREDESASLLQQVRWSPGERRPATMVRFAVGVDLKAPSGLEDYRPIGKSQAAGNNPGGGGSDPGYAASSGMGQPGGQPSKGEKNLGDLTGRFGEELVKAFEADWDKGDFGTAFKDVEVIQPAQAMQGNNPYGSGMSGLVMSDSYGSPMSSSGDMGYGYGGTPGTEAAKTVDAAPRMRAVPGKVVVPGLLYVGTGTVAELSEKAQQEGIDFLFLFEVSVKAARGVIHNDTRLRLVATKDGSALGATSTLNNLKVDRAMATKSESDDVEKQISNIFRKVDPIKLTDMPKLEPVHAQARIKSLIEKKPASVLQTLMEIKLFQSMGLLNEEESSAAYQLAIGGAGVALSKGTLEDRQFVLDPLLPPYK